MGFIIREVNKSHIDNSDHIPNYFFGTKKDFDLWRNLWEYPLTVIEFNTQEELDIWKREEE
jgi:hypothetical protein